MAAQPPRPKQPPLTALRASEVAGRLGVFAPAAQELGVTPGAVTAHLKTLESALGVTLFDRRARGVQLTDLGARLLPEFSAAFAALDAAVARLAAEGAPDLVRIRASADLAQLWLSPRLPALRRAGFQVVPQTDPAPAADLALLLAPGDGIPAPLIAVAAPGIAPPSPAGLRPTQALTLTGEAGDWMRWVRAAGIPAFRPRGAVHTTAALAIEEAANGAGVLVIVRPLAEAALAAGRLVTPYATDAPSGLSLRISNLRPLSAAAQQVLEALGDGAR